MPLTNFLKYSYLIILVWLLGGIFGLHRFLLGFYRTGILMALWSIFAFVIARNADLGFMRVAIIIWWLADLALLLWLLFFNKSNKARDFIVVQSNEAQMLYNQGKIKQAYIASQQGIADFDKLTVNTDYMANEMVHCLSNHIQLARENDQDEDARVTVNRVEQLLDSDFEIDIENSLVANLNRGLVYLDNENFEKAKSVFEQALKWCQEYDMDTPLKDEFQQGLTRAIQGLQQSNCTVIPIIKAQARSLSILLKYRLAEALIEKSDNWLEQDRELDLRLNQYLQLVNSEQPRESPLTGIHGQYLTINGFDSIVITLPTALYSNEPIYMALTKLQKSQHPIIYVLEKTTTEGMYALVFISESHRGNCGFISSREIQDFVKEVEKSAGN